MNPRTTIARVVLGLAAVWVLGLSAAGLAVAQIRPDQPPKEQPRLNLPTPAPSVAAVSVVGGSPTPLQNVTVDLTVTALGASAVRFDPTYDPIVQRQVCYFVQNSVTIDGPAGLTLP